ncbi:MAG: site-2 protease family protein [Bdellovibrionales bacterium]
MQNFDLLAFLAKLGVYFVPFLLALCFHEYAHGLVAKFRGDNTAEMSGRLTLNPMAHADPVGTWMLPLLTILFNSPFFFGWAKPVPVNTRNLRGRLDMFWVALAGPMSNVLLAVVATFLMAFAMVYLRGQGADKAVRTMLDTFIHINLFLAVFNMIPIHPLDGGKIIEPFLPARWNIWLMENQSQLGMFLLVFIMLGGGFLSIPVNIAYNGLSALAYHLATALG